MTTHAVPVVSGRRAFPLEAALSLLLPAIGVVAVAAASGGYFPTSFGWTALAFSWVVLVAAISTAARWRTLDGVWAGAAAAFCVLTLGSALWAGSAGLAVQAGERSLVYATAVAGSLLVLRRRRIELWVGGLVLGAAGVSFYALATRLLPDRFGAFNADAGYRLFVPIGYWNGLGAFAAIGALLAVGLAISGRNLPLRVAAGASLVVFLPTLYYTFSRGAWAALLLGVVVMLAYSPARLRLLGGLAVVGPVPVLAVWLASSPQALTNRSTAIAAATHAGHRLALELFLLAIAQALLAVVWVVWASRIRVSASAQRAVAWALVACVLLGLVLLFAREGSPSSIARRGYDSFTASPTTPVDLNSRLFTFSNHGRLVLWRAAWDEYVDHPLLGGGAGSFQRQWYSVRTNPYTVVDAHNLYAQTLGELGLVGALLLVVFLGAPLVAAVKARRDPLAVAALGAYVAFLAHSIVDWDWQLPAVTLLALFAGTTLVVAARGDRETASAPLRRGMRVALAVAAVACGAFAFVGLIGNLALSRAEAAVRVADGTKAAAEAKTAVRWAPWSTEALRVRAQGELIAGNRAAGLADLRRATRRDPRDWESWFDLASVTTGAEQRVAIARVKALNPQAPELKLLEQPPS
jgi:hypothetical protein